MKNPILAAVMLSVISSASLASSQGQALRAAVPPPYSATFTRATHAPSLNSVDGRLADQLPDLKSRAEAGDAAAAATIYASLVECRAAAAASMSHGAPANCAGLTPEDIAGAGKWLDMAARNGDVGAQYGFAASGFDDLIGAQAAQKDPAAVARYAERARGYLSSLSKQCNYDAIGLIARDSGQQSLIYKRDFNQAYKYLVIKETIARTPHDDTAYRSYLEKNIVPPATVASLRQEAADFVAQNCR
jgi:hypothetical protein